MSTVAVLRNVPVFAGMTDRELQLLAGSLGKHAFAKGMIILRWDGHDRHLHIVEPDQDIPDLTGRTGELSFLDALPPSAGAVALEKTVILTLHRRYVRQHLQTHPILPRTINEVLNKRPHHTTHSESIHGAAPLGV